MRTRLSAEAAAYLRAEANYLRSHSPNAARAFLAAILEARRNLTSFPDIGSARGRLPIPGARTLVVGAYLLDYVLVDDVIQIVSVRHGRQQSLTPEVEDDEGYED
jgi:plasmid stabilization system protein ParE